MRTIFTLLILAGTVHAEDKAAAREAYDMASKHFYLNEFDKALEQYKRAYMNYEDPAFLFNIAQCYRQLGKKDDAVKMYRNYLRRSPAAANRAEVERLIVILDREIAQERSTRTVPPQGPIEAPREVASAPLPATTTPPPPAAPAPAPAPAVTVTHGEKTPVYKKWWLWTAVAGAAVAVGLGVGLGLGLSQSESYPATSPSNGTFRF
jgi:tetratricopeptide (TPR) repeat protein